MIIDLNNGGSIGIRSYDVCICGAGVAGITLAIKLASKGKKIAIFEAGGDKYTEASQSIYEGESIGLTYYGVSACRLRYLGGTSNHWAGRTMLMQAVDFMDRDYFPLPGWPIKKSELDKYKKNAFEILGLDEDSFKKVEVPQLKSSSMKSIEHGSTPPVRFGEKYYKKILKSKNIDLFINANLVDLKLNNSFNYVSQLVIKNYSDDTYTFSGKKVILAMGTIENARLLLNSNSQLPKGIGNNSDYVGRCFMEHFQIILGEYSINPNNTIWSSKDSLELFPRDKYVLDKRIGTSVISFGKADHRSYGRLKVIKKFIKESVCASDALADYSKSLFDFNCPGDGVISTLCEQSPNKNSRVTLSNEKDSLGLQRILLDWRVNELDKRTIHMLAMETAKEFARLDLGRVKLKDYIISNELDGKLGAHCHQMGTTRMSSSPSDGVVDVNSKVFGVDNLYIAGSSVFSTGGGVNPTLTIVQLSLRLAEHLSNLK